MNSSLFDSLNDLAQLPEKNRGSWLGEAMLGVKFLVQNLKNQEDIILYASGTHLYVHSFLVLKTAVDLPNHEEINQVGGILPSDSWRIQRSYWNGGGAQIYINPPLGKQDCKICEHAEKLVFVREFIGMNDYPPTIEISQKLVHTLDLHYMDERKSYCRLNEFGDIENIIWVHNDTSHNSRKLACVVTVRKNDLTKYMVAGDFALVTKFNFIRFVPGEFWGWSNNEENIFQDEAVYYKFNVSPNHASYATGHIVFHTNRTVGDLIEECKAEEDSSERKYVEFKIFDRKNNCRAETSCGPDHITNYFANSDLPWELSPAFFQPNVLQKYKMDREKYAIGDRYVSCRNAWNLDYDINEAGQIHAWIGDLAKLPYEEQLYWKSFNEWPKGTISKRTCENDLLGEVSSEEDTLYKLKNLVWSLNNKQPIWWKVCSTELVDRVLYPTTDSAEEWKREILALDHLIVENIDVQGLKRVINPHGDQSIRVRGRLKLLESALLLTGKQEIEVNKLIAPLEELRKVRNLIAHGDIAGEQSKITSTRKEYGSLRQQFKDLVESIYISIQEIEGSLKSGS